MCIRKFTTNGKEEYQIIFDDDGQIISVNFNGCHEGSILLDKRFSDFHEGYEYYHITNLGLDNCKGKGIGTECLKLHKKIFDSILTASSSLDSGKCDDGSHLTMDGIKFIAKMRELKIVEDDESYDRPYD
ncbi:hypothetical protein AB7Z57_07655 [Providencia alcalifaciens]